MRSIPLATFVFGASLSCFAEDKLPGFDSPEKAFHAYLTAAVSQDYDSMLSSADGQTVSADMEKDSRPPCAHKNARLSDWDGPRALARCWAADDWVLPFAG